MRGALPPGLHLHADGTVTGRATRIGRWTVTVRVADAETPIGSALRRITVAVTRG